MNRHLPQNCDEGHIIDCYRTETQHLFASRGANGGYLLVTLPRSSGEHVEPRQFRGVRDAKSVGLHRLYPFKVWVSSQNSSVHFLNTRPASNSFSGNHAGRCFGLHVKVDGYYDDKLVPCSITANYSLRAESALCARYKQ
jgi:hypothetical protein